MKAIICGGGTVGHVTPGISIAEAILKKEPKSTVLFVGREGGEENEVVKKRGYKQYYLKVSGLKRRITLDNVRTLIKMQKALHESKKILKAESPNVVIGTGGYVCWPMLRAAQKLKIPTLIHESNLSPGAAALLLSKKCDRVLLNFKESEKSFKSRKKLTVVGNPIPDSFSTTTRESARKRLMLKNTDIFILSFGGSGGAEIINRFAIGLMRKYSEKRLGIRHVHATGRKYFKELQIANPDLVQGRNGCKILPFIDDMALYMKAADIIISRCGAMTLSEICACECVPILIPSPNVTNNHQYKNAKVFTDNGAAIMIEESELCDTVLLDAIKYIESNPAIRKKIKSNLAKFKTDDVNDKIYAAIKSVAK